MKWSFNFYLHTVCLKQPKATPNFNIGRWTRRTRLLQFNFFVQKKIRPHLPGLRRVFVKKKFRPYQNYQAEQNFCKKNLRPLQNSDNQTYQHLVSVVFTFKMGFCPAQNLSRRVHKAAEKSTNTERQAGSIELEENTEHGVDCPPKKLKKTRPYDVVVQNHVQKSFKKLRPYRLSWVS